MPVVAPSPTPVYVSELIERTRRHLFSTERSERNRLTTTINGSETAVVCDFALEGIQPGSYITIDDEQMYVWAIDAPSRTVTVMRADLGTTASSHQAGALIEVDVRFPRPYILTALLDEVRSWPPTLFRPTTVALSLSAGERAVDLDGVSGLAYDVLVARVSPPAGAVAHSWPRVDARLERDQDTTKFTSGYAVVCGQSFGDGRTLRVTVSQPIDTSIWTETTDLIVSGFTEGMIDIAPLGTAARLLGPKEGLRDDPTRQGEPRRAEEVPVTAIQRAAAAFQVQRDQRINDEAGRLRAYWRIRGA